MKAFCVNTELLLSEEQFPCEVTDWKERQKSSLTWRPCHTSFHSFYFFFPLSKQTECWSSENMMLSHFSCRVLKLGLWERVWYNSMTEVIPLSIWALNGPLKYSLVRKNFSKWCFLIFIIIIIIIPLSNRLQPGPENAVQSLLVTS